MEQYREAHDLNDETEIKLTKASETEKDEVDTSLMSNVEPIPKGKTGFLLNREQLDAYVELPLREACKIFYDLNIPTTNSSCNRYDAMKNGIGYIQIDLPYLSEENSIIAKQLVEEGLASFDSDSHSGEEQLFIDFPINKDSKWQDISEQAVEIAHRFKKQAFSPLSMITVERFREDFVGVDPNDERWTPQLLIRKVGIGYYNSQTNLIYLDPAKYQESMSTGE